MSKKDLSEADIKAIFITPAILNVGWDELTQLGREIYFTDGRIYVKGKLTASGKRKFADFILFYKPNVPKIANLAFKRTIMLMFPALTLPANR